MFFDCTNYMEKSFFICRNSKWRKVISKRNCGKDCEIYKLQDLIIRYCSYVTIIIQHLGISVLTSHYRDQCLVT